MRRKKLAIILASVVVLAGLASVWFMLGANAVPSGLEAENGTETANATVVTDATASGGSAVKFDAASTGGTGGTGGTGCSGVLSGGQCYPTPPAPVSSGKSWQLKFNDEFATNTLDTTKWTPCFDWNYGSCSDSFNHGKERYLPSQVQINNGTAKLVGEPLSPPYSSAGCYQGSCTYKSGMLATSRPLASGNDPYRYTFTYGYVEANMKVPSTRGFFSAFWMLPASPSYTYPTEIDILEFLAGSNDTAFMTYHYNDRSQSHAVNNGEHNNGACAAVNFTTAFHKYAVDWQPGYVAWYIDGVKCGQYTGTTGAVPMQIIIDMMVDNDWQRDFGLTLQSQTATAQLEVDYVRVFQQQ